jgi:hypothetical protein
VKHAGLHSGNALNFTQEQQSHLLQELSADPSQLGRTISIQDLTDFLSLLANHHPVRSSLSQSEHAPERPQLLNDAQHQALHSSLTASHTNTPSTSAKLATTPTISASTISAPQHATHQQQSALSSKSKKSNLKRNENEDSSESSAAETLTALRGTLPTTLPTSIFPSMPKTPASGSSYVPHTQHAVSHIPAKLPSSILSNLPPPPPQSAPPPPRTRSSTARAAEAPASSIMAHQAPTAASTQKSILPNEACQAPHTASQVAGNGILQSTLISPIAQAQVRAQAEHWPEPSPHIEMSSMSVDTLLRSISCFLANRLPRSASSSSSQPQAAVLAAPGEVATGSISLPSQGCQIVPLSLTTQP